MAQFAALPIFTDALLADTLHLSDAEFGLYMRLLVLLWRSPDCRIPNDKAWIAKRLGRTALAYDGEIAPIVDEFCQKDGNYIIQKRLLKEFEYIRNKSKSQSSKANARWGNENAKKTRKNASSESVSDKPLKQHDLDLCPGDAPTPTPTPTDISKDISPYSPQKDLEGEGWFEERFWKPYPKQRAGSKDAARRAMKKALTKTTKEEIENAVHNYAQSDEVARGYAKGAAAWLNDERWTHDYTATPRSNGQHHVQKASYLDKLSRAGEGARQLIKNRMDADRDAPWNIEQPSQSGGHLSDLSEGQLLIPNGAGEKTRR